MNFSLERCLDTEWHGKLSTVPHQCFISYYARCKQRKCKWWLLRPIFRYYFNCPLFACGVSTGQLGSHALRNVNVGCEI